ncbi:MAG: TonB-dependent receptor, partial [Armatimonadota bacterium]|nr:TonB-dependent receptor [Armatimonadota bacterium]
MGVFGGKRSLRYDTFFPELDPDNLIDERALNRLDVRLRAEGAYVRDEYLLSNRLSVIGEIQLQHLSRFSTQRDLLPEATEPELSEGSKTALLPKLVLAYQPNARTGIRFRARRVLATPQDFQLLSPTDVFFESEGLPEVRSRGAEFGSGQTYELEFDHTFRNTSFLRLGLFRQNLDLAGIFNRGFFETPQRGVHQHGARLSYEGVLSRSTAFYTRLNFNHSRDGRSNEVFLVPRFAAEIGLQYLNSRGYFVQPLFFYSGSRLENVGNPAVRLDSFKILNLRVGKRWGVRSTVFLELNNAFNERYSIFRDLQPGRQLRLGTTRRF